MYECEYYESERIDKRSLYVNWIKQLLFRNINYRQSLAHGLKSACSRIKVNWPNNIYKYVNQINK